MSLFDDHRLVANAGLILPATLALHLGLPQLVRMHLDLGDAPGRANTGDKMMTLVASALAGGDCIDDADVLRTGGTACALGCVVKAPSTLGTFLRSFRWGHVRQLDRVSRQLLARGLGRWGRPRRLAPDHRPGLDHLRDLRSGQGEGRATTATPAPVAITRYWPLPPAPAAPPTSCGRRWDGCATAVPGDNSRCGPTAVSTPTPCEVGWEKWTPKSDKLERRRCQDEEGPARKV